MTSSSLLFLLLMHKNESLFYALLFMTGDNVTNATTTTSATPTPTEKMPEPSKKSVVSS